LSSNKIKKNAQLVSEIFVQNFKKLTMKKYLLFLLFLIPVFLSGCATVPQELTAKEKENGLTIYRQNTYGGALSTIFFEVNDEKYKLGPKDVINIKPNIGANTFATTGVQFLGDLNESAYQSQKFIFQYKKDEVVRLGLAFSHPTVVDIYSASGELKKNYKFENLRASHTISVNPGNVIINMSDKTFNIEKQLIDDSKSTPNLRKTEFTFLVQKGEVRKVNISIKWLDFDDEINYVLDLQGGVNSEKTVEPSKKSRKYLLHLAKKLNGVERVEFLCKNELISNYKNIQLCIDTEIAEFNQQQQVEKEKQYQKSIQSMLDTKEGVSCEKKFKGIESRDAFLKCFRDAYAKSNADKKFAEASSSKDGATCLKKSPTDSPAFWKCFDENVATSEKIKKDDIAQQCISIGFEYQSKDYGDCYLKLKIHTEQIAQWKKMQNAIESQSNLNVITNKPTADQADSVERNLDLARRGFESAYGSRAPALLQPPPPPVRIITPIGNSYNCSMMGAALRCR